MSKKVVSISLGSPERDYEKLYKIGETEITVKRIGTDGDLKKYQELLEELDGKVDAFGIGGTDLYLRKGERKYKLHGIWKLIKNVKHTPIVDGGGIKNTLERDVMKFVEDNIPEEVQDDRSILVTCAVDRWGMAESAWEFVNHNKKLITFGDTLWGLKVGIAFHCLKKVGRFATIMMPIVGRLPFSMLYPTGEKQKVNKPKHSKYFEKAKFIAGDFLFIKTNMPMDKMQGKIIITNTTTAEDVKMLKEIGIKYLITTTPRVEGRSFGTNVLEGALVAISGKSGELHPDEYRTYFNQYGIKPTLEKLN